MAAMLIATAAPAAASHPGYSGLLAFGYNGGGNFEIYTSRPDGSERRQITDNGAFNACASWSPDGRYLAYCSSVEDGFQIWVMRVDGSDPRRISRGVGFAIYPTWSPDGRRLLFSAATDGDSPTDLYVVDRDGSGQRNLTSSPATEATSGGSWSPNGRRIVFDSDQSGNFDLYTMRSDGTDVRPLTSGPENDNAPRWSPKGRLIAFDRSTSRPDEAPNTDIYVVDRGGRHIRPVTQNEVTFDTGPAWSPDGRSLVFRHFNADDTADLAIVRLASGRVRIVDQTPGAELAPSWGRLSHGCR